VDRARESTDLYTAYSNTNCDTPKPSSLPHFIALLALHGELGRRCIITLRLSFKRLVKCQNIAVNNASIYRSGKCGIRYGLNNKSKKQNYHQASNQVDRINTNAFRFIWLKAKDISPKY
jgi:hypothetical protein